MQYIGPLEYQKIFRETVLAQVKAIIPNVEHLLAAWTVYLGHNPTNPARPNSGNPHADFERKYWYIPMPDLIPGENRDEIQLVELWRHEGAHGLHEELLGANVPKWMEWARETGYTLDLTWRQGGPGKERWDPHYWYVPSYEDFAEDVDRMILEKNPNPYYMKLFSLHYQILTPGSRTYIVDGRPVEKDAEPIILDGRTRTPTRHTHENFGDKVHFSDDGQILIIRA